MSQYKETIDADLNGRLMFLEQRTKGLQGRISALEVRLSGSAACDNNGIGSLDDTDFIPAARFSDPGREQMPTSDQAWQHERPRQGRDRVFEATGLMAGAILIGAGLLLYTGNLEILRNPLVVMSCGILLITGAVLRLVL